MAVAKLSDVTVEKSRSKSNSKRPVKMWKLQAGNDFIYNVCIYIYVCVCACACVCVCACVWGDTSCFPQDERDGISFITITSVGVGKS